MPYEDPIIAKYIDTIKAGTSAFKVFYFGDPIRIPASELPCLIVAKVDTRVSNMTNEEDMHQIMMDVGLRDPRRLVFNHIG